VFVGLLFVLFGATPFPVIPMQTSPDGLYDPSYEHDACGVGLVCNIQGRTSHDIIRKGLEILVNLEHRGACGCDARTGDGAGILIQVPDAFLRDEAERLGIVLPGSGAYGVGLVFLPQEAAAQEAGKALFNQVIAEEGQVLLGWRAVPTNPSCLGERAQASAPSLWHVFIGKGAETLTGEAFERKLFVIRKVMERRSPDASFYVASLSTRTLVYKGMLTVDQVSDFFLDLTNPRLESALAMVHSRFSTNTLPSWPLAHPFRFLCHNGEINTQRGNANWMKAREALFQASDFGDDLDKVLPVLEEGGSDSQKLDNALELLYFTGRSLPHAMMMLIPEAWEHHDSMDEELRAFYAYHACLMEPWDGPATVPFTDGRYVGALLDRNGLRPSRYTITKDGYAMLSSEAGVLEIDPANVLEKGRLQPGRMFLVDLKEQRIVRDEEIKAQLSRRRPYQAWLKAQMVILADLPDGAPQARLDPEERARRQRRFGYTLEDLRLQLAPMGRDGSEAIGSMGTDTPIAVLSNHARPLYDYFKQLFAQVTNPPLDAMREELVTSLFTNLGAQGNLFDEIPEHARQIRLDQPILTAEDLARIRAIDRPGFKVCTLPADFELSAGGEGLAQALTALCTAAAAAVDEGHSLLILSDRAMPAERAPIPALLATGAVHHHLIRTGRRPQCSLVVESGEPREVHHFALLLGYGAGAVHPYLALETVREMAEHEELEEVGPEEAVYHFVKAVGKGLLKVMSKMGISTLQSYRGAQIFEALGLSKTVVDAYFTGTASRLGGIGLDVLAQEVGIHHMAAFPEADIAGALGLPVGGRFQWRRNGEHHLYNPLTIAQLQQAVRKDDANTYAEYAQRVNDQAKILGTLRGLLAFDPDAQPVPLDEVEPWTAIVKRFKTGAMSYGSISQETHETLAVAMNALGGRSNTGEGGEDPGRYPAENPRRSRIKQVASGRFGVTISYLVSADEIQIKMAQGAKPGEGGQLPGKKVYPWIAKTRHSTPYVGLISPPPHHDIYSIEDLAQLIHDLKNANPQARISVKLVSEVGVGTIAAGVAKGKAEVILISGYDGGTGASPLSSTMHAGLPWELGLAETQQTLLRNGLRSRVKLECDGQLKTGRDVAIAALLGADEFGFATAPLVAMGCIMMRKCHLNTCPVGIATQDPLLREKFAGQPEHVINFFHFVAEELRTIMAQLGFRTLDGMVGRVDRLQRRADVTHWKAKYLDLSAMLFCPARPARLDSFTEEGQDHGLEGALDHTLIDLARPALEGGRPVSITAPISNRNRTVGTMLSSEVSRRYGAEGLPDDTITVSLNGSAGQSFGAFAAPGLTMKIIGEANDYFGKGLSGAKLILQPPATVTYPPNMNIIVGNVALYGATSGEVYIRGQAGERFAVRNSGVRAVVEGVGDHGCEYMTGGRVVILGPTGRNFGAGMSGGIAYVLDGTWEFRNGRCNTEMVDLTAVTDAEEIAELRAMVESHWHYTQSHVARWVLDYWHLALNEFVRIMPSEYHKALLRLSREEAAAHQQVAA